MTNYFIIPSRVSVYHDQEGFDCSSADVSSCVYEEGWCPIGSAMLIWEIESKARCKYSPFKVMPGQLLNKAWLATDGSLALTHMEESVELDCGVNLTISDQGIPFMTVDNEDHLSVISYHGESNRLTPLD